MLPDVNVGQTDVFSSRPVALRSVVWYVCAYIYACVGAGNSIRCSLFDTGGQGSTAGMGRAGQSHKVEWIVSVCTY